MGTYSEFNQAFIEEAPFKNRYSYSFKMLLRDGQPAECLKRCRNDARVIDEIDRIHDFSN